MYEKSLGNMKRLTEEFQIMTAQASNNTSSGVNISQFSLHFTTTDGDFIKHTLCIHKTSSFSTTQNQNRPMKSIRIIVVSELFGRDFLSVRLGTSTTYAPQKSSPIQKKSYK